MGRLESIDINSPTDNVCLDLPISAVDFYEFVQDLSWRLAAHDAVDHESLVRFGGHANIDAGFIMSVGVNDAGMSLTLHCRVLPKVE